MSDKFTIDTPLAEIEGLDTSKIPGGVTTINDFLGNYQSVHSQLTNFRNNERNPKPVDAYNDDVLMQDPNVAALINSKSEAHHEMNEAMKAAGIRQNQRDIFMKTLLTKAAVAQQYDEQDIQEEQEEWSEAMNDTFSNNARAVAELYQNITGQSPIGVHLDNIINVVETYRAAQNNGTNPNPNAGQAATNTANVPDAWKVRLTDGTIVGVNPTDLKSIESLTTLETKDQNGKSVLAFDVNRNLQDLHKNATLYFGQNYQKTFK